MHPERSDENQVSGKRTGFSFGYSGISETEVSTSRVQKDKRKTLF